MDATGLALQPVLVLLAGEKKRAGARPALWQ